MLASMEEAMMPKKRNLETGADVKPEASILDRQDNYTLADTRDFKYPETT